MTGAATAVRQRPRMADGVSSVPSAFELQGARPDSTERQEHGHPHLHAHHVHLQQRLAAIRADRTLMAWVAAAVLLAWFAALAVGCSYYDGMRPKHSKLLKASQGELLLQLFDRLFRAVGALLPFTVLIFRLASRFFLEGSAFPEGKEQPRIVVLYVFMTAVRALVYNFLLLVGKWSSGGSSSSGPVTLMAAEGAVGSDFTEMQPATPRRDTMSDHVFLAACILAQLLAEAAILVRMLRGTRTKPGMRVAAAAALAATCGWLALTVGEVYVTARHYHPNIEIAKAALAGLVVFQAPIVYFAAVMLPENRHF